MNRYVTHLAAQTPAEWPDLRAPARDLAPVVKLPVADLEAMLTTAAERGAGRALEAIGAVTEAEGLSRIGEPQRPVEAEMVDAKTLASLLGFSRQTIYARARRWAESEPIRRRLGGSIRRSPGSVSPATEAGGRRPRMTPRSKL